MRKIRRLLAYAAPHRRAFVVIGLLTLLSSALAALQPWPMKLLVDHVLGSEAGAGGASIRRPHSAFESDSVGASRYHRPGRAGVVRAELRD